jgi:hypothetical protein
MMGIRTHGKPALEDDTGQALIKALKKLDSNIVNVSDFPVFEDFLIRCDRFVGSLSPENYMPYGTGKATDYFMEHKKDLLKPKLGQFAGVFGDNNNHILSIIELINIPGFPNFSAIEQECWKLKEDADRLDIPDSNKGILKHRIDDFFLGDIHERIAIQGMASQHHCTSVEQAYGTSEEKLTGKYLCGVISDETKDYITKASWPEFFDMFNSEEIKRERLKLYRMLVNTNRTMTDMQIKELSKTIEKITKGSISGQSGFTSAGVLSITPTLEGEDTHLIGEDSVAYRLESSNLR